MPGVALRRTEIALIAEGLPWPVGQPVLDDRPGDRLTEAKEARSGDLRPSQWAPL